jgi:hypothetical protein
MYIPWPHLNYHLVTLSLQSSSYRSDCELVWRHCKENFHFVLCFFELVKKCWTLSGCQFKMRWVSPGAVVHSVQLAPCQPERHRHSPPTCMYTGWLRNFATRNIHETSCLTTRNCEEISLFRNFVDHPTCIKIFCKKIYYKIFKNYYCNIY